MRSEDINIDDPVLYIPEHLLTGPKENMIKHEHLGVVTSKNGNYIFVRYKGSQCSQATRADDLYTIRNRPDLIEILNSAE